jgi:MOSC domain-containing protein YiiM
MVTRQTIGEVLRVMVLEPEAKIISTPVESVEVTEAGFAGDRHAGMTRKADVRTKGVERGTPVKNTRQVSLVAEEELAEIARRLQIETVEPQWLGANLCLRGVDGLTRLAAGSRLVFSQGVELTIEGENQPCTGPGEAVEVHYPDRAGLASQFPKQAMHLRGLVGWVTSPGRIAVGDQVEVHPPEEPGAA